MRHTRHPRHLSIIDPMRRGVRLVLLLVLASFLVVVGGMVAIYLLVMPSIKVPERSTLVLRPGGELLDIVAERRAAVRGPIGCAHRARLRGGAAQGEDRQARHRRAARAAPIQLAVLGEGAGAARGGRRFPDVGQAGLRVPGVRRRSRVLPRQRGGQDLPGADRHARSHRRGDLRSVPARHARSDRHLPRSDAHRRLQDRHQHVHREGLHARRTRR